MIHTVKGFGIVNKAEIDIFLELSCFFDDPSDVGNLISGSSAFFETSLFFARNDAKAETPVLWPPHAKSWLNGKDSDAGRDWGQEKKGTTEDEMAGWYHGLDGRWVWVNSRSWWWTGRPGVLQFMGSQRVGLSDWTELNIWKFTVHVLLKPGLENFGHYFASVWDECNCAVVWAFFGIAFLWDWKENWPFQSCGHCWVFQICWHTCCCHRGDEENSGPERLQ